LPPEGYQHSLAVWFSPRVLPWVAPACLLLVFVLLFFDWTGLYPGGVPAVTGNAWRAAFGAYWVDGDIKAYTIDGELTPVLAVTGDEKNEPGVSVLTILYLLLFFPVLVVTVASVVITMIPVKLPPQADQLLPWRWGIAAAANLILFLFLGLQVLLGFSLDNRYTDWANKASKLDKPNPTGAERKTADARRGELLEIQQHTNWLRLVVLLHLTAIVCAALMFWLNRRGTHRPLPKIELVW
jgi:hypothetical protein